MKQLIIGVTVGILISAGIYLVLAKQKDVLPTKTEQTHTVDEHNATKDTHNSTVDILGSDKAKKIIEKQANTVLQQIASKDITALSSHIHPTKGLRFSLYGHVAPDTDETFLPKELPLAWEADKPYVWGEEDGTGDAIELSVKQYFEQILYKTDFQEDARKIGYNEIIGNGNTINNSQEIYPDAIIVEYHYPGSEEFSGMDWSSLSLVFEKENEQWYLVGLINNQWTI